MAEGNYATWMMYLLIINVLSSLVFGAMFAITNEGFSGNTPEVPDDVQVTFGIGAYSFATTFILSLIFVPFNLWGLAYPVGLLLVLFFGLLKIGIGICIWKIINPVNSG